MLLCWLVYACSYIGKVNYAANINEVMSFYGVEHASAGLVSTFFFFAYGVGQVVNGILCKKYNLKWIIFLSLFVSGFINFMVGVSDNFVLVKYLWLINGFSMSILWPTLIRLLSENLMQKDMAKASLIMGTTVATGTFIVYGLSAVFVRINFKITFYVAAILLLLISLIWLFSVSKITAAVQKENGDEEKNQAISKELEREKYNKAALLLSICMLAFYGVATNLIKDGLTTWVPSILKEQYELGSSFSIVLTLFLPVVAMFSNAFAVKVHKKIPDYVLHCAVIFFCSAAIIGGVIGGLSLNQFWLTLIGFTAVCFLVSSCNSVITSIFPLFMKKRVNAGFIAGILNGCCYLGSTISSYGLGAIADNYNWTTVFWVLFFVCIAVCVGAILYYFIKKIIVKADKSSD